VDTANLRLPEYYISRELSRLAFNVRVLNQAKDPEVPLFERLKFPCICSTDLDELFEIRVSNIKQRLEVSSAPSGPDNLSPAEVLKTIADQTYEHLSRRQR
jgi:polyphosphate kinase